MLIKTVGNLSFGQNMAFWQFLFRTLFQVAACVYSTELLENTEKKEENQQSVVMHIENHMFHKTAYMRCVEDVKGEMQK